MLWPVLALVALAWPSRALGLLDGLPLNGRAEALLLGLVVPALLWFAPQILQRNLIRVAIAGLLALKIAGLALTPQGLCARFSTTAPFVGETHTIPIDEPQGWLRSWDVRANWRDTNPKCTAIVDRGYADGRSFPAWFVNLVDSIRPRTRFVARADGIPARRPTQACSRCRWRRTCASKVRSAARPSTQSGASISTSLPPGDHPIKLRAALTGERWSLLPQWNDRDAWDAAVFTVAQPRALDRVAGVVGMLTHAPGGGIGRRLAVVRTGDRGAPSRRCWRGRRPPRSRWRSPRRSRGSIDWRR